MIKNIFILFIGFICYSQQENANLFYMAESQKEMGNYSKSIELFDKLLIDNYKCSLIYYRRAFAEEANGNLDSAIENIESAIRNDINCEIDKKYPDGMVERFIAQNRTFYYKEQARIFMDLSKYGEAISKYTKALENQKEEDIYLYYQRGIAKHKACDLQGSINDFNIYINAKNDKGAFVERASVKFDLNDYEGTINDCTVYLDTAKSNNGYAHFLRGIAFMQINKVRKGCDDLSKAGEQGIKESYELIKKYCY